MKIFEVTGENAGGVPFKYRVREADIEGPKMDGEPISLTHLARALEVIYDFSQEIRFPDFGFIHIRIVEEEI